MPEAEANNAPRSRAFAIRIVATLVAVVAGGLGGVPAHESVREAARRL